MITPTILVTGAAGNIGRPLVAGLLADGAQVRALTRDPAAGRFPPAVTVHGGEYAAPGILAEAVRGADAVFVNIGALREHANELIAEARAAGVSKIVMLSSIAVRDEGDQVLSLGRQHKAVEDAVKAAGADWTKPGRPSGAETGAKRLSGAFLVSEDGVMAASDVSSPNTSSITVAPPTMAGTITWR